MAALKSIVIGLGILIVLGMTLLAWGIYRKAADPDFSLGAGTFASPATDTPTAATAPTINTRPLQAFGDPLQAFGDMTIPLPEGCAIAAMRPQGERLFLRVGPPGPCARVIVVDIGRGKVLGTIAAAP